jgi:hypothetical protein
MRVEAAQLTISGNFRKTGANVNTGSTTKAPGTGGAETEATQVETGEKVISILTHL